MYMRNPVLTDPYSWIWSHRASDGFLAYNPPPLLLLPSCHLVACLPKVMPEFSVGIQLMKRLVSNPAAYLVIQVTSKVDESTISHNHLDGVSKTRTAFKDFARSIRFSVLNLEVC